MIKDKHFRKWYNKNRISHIENMKQYYRDNREERLNYQLAYYQRNKEERQKYQREYYNGFDCREFEVENLYGNWNK